ncbi:helix-turn-helix domain-containing protein [Desulfosarcina sp. OttesenSCG-928-A07]|nr:helix-turn-helix domain-containing protein [Desulfosarcina sp. OttesenSCG-928-G17]MDL2329564.1 helix-turn-helix domain-containing protein [Desulfosarcina sp. OttesenSCG-928-A07]
MFNVTVLALHQTSASTITGPMDVFHQAGVMWNHFNGKKITPFFQVRVATLTGEPFICANGVRMAADGAIDDINDSDLIIVSSISKIDAGIRLHRPAIDWLETQYRRGAHIASICTGSFLLAETGLLDGKAATTHWAFADAFAKRYPSVNLKIDQPIVDEKDLFCSGGYNASMDLSLYLVEKYCGQEVAVQSAKVITADTLQQIGLSNTTVQFGKAHQDSGILKVQKWIEENYTQNFNYDGLAQTTHMSRRTLERRFKAATGTTPLSYQQCIRVNAAKHLLEQGAHSFDEVTVHVGYADASTFRRIFMRHTGLTPTQYRKQHAVYKDLTK